MSAKLWFEYFPEWPWLGRALGSGRRFPFSLKDLFDVSYQCRRVKWAYQRVTRGWSDDDCWNLGGTFARRMAEAMERFRQHCRTGVPGGLVEGPDGDVDAAIPKWEAILAKIETGLRAAEHMTNDCECFIGAFMEPRTRPHPTREEYQQHDAKHRAEWEEGMDLLKEWQLAIWD